MTTIGQRVNVTSDTLHELPAGAYSKVDGQWYCRPPGTGEAFIGRLGRHIVTEHEDGTITASPSILISDGKFSWHGYLEKGVWRQL